MFPLRFSMSSLGVVVVLLATLSTALPLPAARPQDAVTAGNAQDKPFVVEYYYKVKWGHADEFISLFRKNHYPLLKKQVEMGRMLKVSAVAPRYHTT